VNAGHNSRSLQAHLGHRNICYTELLPDRFKGFLSVADMAISERELEAARTARAVRTARADAAGRRDDVAGHRDRTKPTRHSCGDRRGEWSGKQVRRVLERLP
jgi:hypothetical protein